MERVLLARKPFFTEDQFDRISNILDNAGQVALAIAVLSPLIGEFDKRTLFIVASGIILVSSCWSTSIWLSRKGKNEF